MHLPRGDHDTAKLHREWLRSIVAQIGMPPTTLAKAIKVAPSTLTRPLQEGDAGTSTLHATTIEKIVSFTGLPGPGTAAPQGRALRGLSTDAEPYAWRNGDPFTDAVRALIAGRPAADPWVLKTRALDLLGYMPGDVVIVDLGREAQPGDLVCAQINIDWPRGTAETVMRIYERVGAALVLSAASSDLSLRAPIAVDDRVAIKGVIDGMLRPRQRAA